MADTDQLPERPIEAKFTKNTVVAGPVDLDSSLSAHKASHFISFPLWGALTATSIA